MPKDSAQIVGPTATSAHYPLESAYPGSLETVGKPGQQLLPDTGVWPNNDWNKRKIHRATRSSLLVVWTACFELRVTGHHGLDTLQMGGADSDGLEACTPNKSVQRAEPGLDFYN